MSEDTSARLALPLLAAGQAQKEMTVNEAMARIDIVLQASAVAGGVDIPPEAPSAGQCWIVGDAPEAAWSGCAGMLAGWTEDGWRVVAPVEGMIVWIEADGFAWRRIDGAWRAGDLTGERLSIEGVQVVGPRLAAIDDPAGGDVTDVEARTAVAAILAALRSHGLITS